MTNNEKYGKTLTYVFGFSTSITVLACIVLNFLIAVGV